jgi:hypothetical protein
MDPAPNTPMAILMILAILDATVLLILATSGLRALLRGQDIFCKLTVPTAIVFVLGIVATTARIWRSGEPRRSIEPHTAIPLLRRPLRRGLGPSTQMRTSLAFRGGISAPRPVTVPHYLTVGERFRQRRAA